MATSLMVDELDDERLAARWGSVSAGGTSAADPSAGEPRHRRAPDDTADPSCPVPDPDLKRRRVAEADELRALLARVATGDRRAFADLYDATSSRVFGMVLRVLRDPGFSEETVQEVFLQIWKTADRYDPAQGSPLAWMMTLAHRRAVDRVRSEQSGTDREALYGSSTHSPAHDEVLESVTQTLESESVVRCLDTLTETQRESVRMAYYSGLTYREVAERLGVAVPTVKSRIRDGLIKLKNCLGVETGE
ncbi:sigma-70 family RNA polymerase sigma factor [Rhodococcus sp. BP-241]|nr:sigma-70 family RNA polymerase sigma factor [Rhodococcus sp. BP-241]